MKITTTLGGVDYHLSAEVSSLYFSFFFKMYTEKIIWWIAKFHMPLFFMLSGAVLNIKPIKPMDVFVCKKIKRLIFPFFICGFFFMLPVKFLGNFYNKDSIINAFRSFSIGGESGHLWFLIALFWCMTCFVLIKKILERLKINSVAIILILAGIVYLQYSKLPFDFFGLKQGLGYIFYFALGFAFESVRDVIENLTKKERLILFIILSLIVCFDFKFTVFGDFSTIIIRAVWTLSLSLLCESVFCNLYYSRTMNIIFANLFAVYLFHDPLEYIVLRFFFHFNLLNYSLGVIFYYFCRTFGVFIASVCIGILLNIVEQKIKSKIQRRTDNVLFQSSRRSGL